MKNAYGMASPQMLGFSILSAGQRMAAGEKKFRLEESPGTTEQDAG